MKIGIGVFPKEMSTSVASTVEMVKLAETMGFSDAWIPDSQGLWKDPYVVLALAAANTQSIKLGLGVTNPITRHPMASARAILTIHEVSQARAIFGLGAGDTSLKALSSKPATVVRCAEYIAAVRNLIDGKEATWEGIQQQLRNIGGLPKIPIYVAANGPVMMRLAGQIADGVIIPVGFTEEFVQYIFKHIDEGLAKAGRRREHIDVCFLAGCAVSGDRAAARQQVKAYVAKRALVPVPSEISGISADEKERFIQAYRIEDHLRVGARHAELVPESWIDRFALAGTSDDVVNKIAQLKDWGVRHLIVLPEVADTASLIKMIGRDVIPKMS